MHEELMNEIDAGNTYENDEMFISIEWVSHIKNTLEKKRAILSNSPLRSGFLTVDYYRYP